MNRLLLATLFCIAYVNAYAGVSSNFAVTSNYVWRGQTQTNNGAAVQGGMDYEHPVGLSAGTWISNIAGGTEADFYASYSYQFTSFLSASVGGTFYHYVKNGASDSSELNLGISLWMFDLSANYMGDYLGNDTSSWYFNIGTSFDLVKKQGLAISLSGGFTTFNDQTKASQKEYFDYKVSLDRTVSDYTVSVFYTNTNRYTTDGTTDTNADDRTFGIMASRSFN